MKQEQIIDLPELDIEIVNVVSSVNIYQKIDLMAIMKVFRNVEYRPKLFPGLVFRLENRRQLL